MLVTQLYPGITEPVNHFKVTYFSSDIQCVKECIQSFCQYGCICELLAP